MRRRYFPQTGSTCPMQRQQADVSSNHHPTSECPLPVSLPSQLRVLSRGRLYAVLHALPSLQVLFLSDTLGARRRLHGVLTSLQDGLAAATKCHGAMQCSSAHPPFISFFGACDSSIDADDGAFDEAFPLFLSAAFSWMIVIDVISEAHPIYERYWTLTARCVTTQFGYYRREWTRNPFT